MNEEVLKEIAATVFSAGIFDVFDVSLLLQRASVVQIDEKLDAAHRLTWIRTAIPLSQEYPRALVIFLAACMHKVGDLIELGYLVEEATGKEIWFVSMLHEGERAMYFSEPMTREDTNTPWKYSTKKLVVCLPWVPDHWVEPIADLGSYLKNYVSPRREKNDRTAA
ncbi:MAG TPA: hypothetical protein VEA59_02430 [Patescibacteria group bacterium]|nr:hypothetical protein [Patescibacteria group bacterium]